jgi:hypothetical protein
VPEAVLDVSIKARHFLRRTLHNIDATTGNVTGLKASLINGDANDDNHIGLLDLGAILSSFGSNDPAADLNGDGHVGFLDLAIVLTNFGLLGDP